MATNNKYIETLSYPIQQDVSIGANNSTPLAQYGDLFSDAIMSGLTTSTSSTLAGTLASGVAYVLGQRVVYPGGNYTIAASSTSYLDLSDTGVLTVSTSDTVTANSLRLWSVTSSASAITGVQQVAPSGAPGLVQPTPQFPAANNSLITAAGAMSYAGNFSGFHWMGDHTSPWLFDGETGNVVQANGSSEFNFVLPSLITNHAPNGVITIIGLANEDPNSIISVENNGYFQNLPNTPASIPMPSGTQFGVFRNIELGQWQLLYASADYASRIFGTADFAGINASSLSVSNSSTISGTTAGTIVSSMPEQGVFKKFGAYASGYENDSTTAQTITFPTPFANPPVVTANTTGLSLIVSTTELTITAPDNTTAYSGLIIVEGF